MNKKNLQAKLHNKLGVTHENNDFSYNARIAGEIALALSRMVDAV